MSGGEVMANKNKKNSSDLTLVIHADEIIGSEIMRNGDYKYARVGIKRNDNEYVSISYEWKGDQVPEFALMLMQWMQANKDALGERQNQLVAEYDVFKERLLQL